MPWVAASPLNLALLTLEKGQIEHVQVQGARRVSGPTRDELTRRKLHKELHDLYSSPHNIRMRWVVRVARMGDKRNVYNILVGKPQG